VIPQPHRPPLGSPPGGSPGHRAGSRKLLWLAAAAVLLGGAATTGYALFGSSRPVPVPVPPAIGLGNSAALRATHAPDWHRTGTRATECGSVAAVASGRGPASPLPYSMPVQISIPAICVRARVIPLGSNRDGTVRVPPLSRPQLTSWFDEGPAPGQAGPAALYGHVDTAAAGPAVFYRLGDLVPGDGVDITLADHRVAVFTVYRVAEYPKSSFPTMTVYGDTRGPELRLITCGGTFDPSAGSYQDNIVAYARLTASK
jgi:Sortase domain